ncbi:11694_t:CDS:2 [Dentiscutata erythropus]|uniref:11694_t:CDS:1 n=1 Tax=Dentiscutata erythropus TaxID=1348616 RepID=A0A9N9GR81_9GLOM|nr:11694_t:CDS:2 [Dentiscutata erythropus]
MDDIDWNSFIAFPNNSDLEDINLLFSLPSKSSNENFADMNSPPPSGYENNSLVNTSLFLPLSESNNNCLQTSIHGNTSYDHNSDYDNISYSKSSNDNFEDTNLSPPSGYVEENKLVNTRLFSPLSESNNNCLPISIHGNNENNTSFNEHDSDFDNTETSILSNDNYGDLNTSGYQYNLRLGSCFDDWLSVDNFIHNYCLEQGFGYQIFRNDKDPNDPTIIHRKSYRCSSSGIYEAQKVIDQNSHHLRGTTKTNCEWHCNFSFPKTSHEIKYTIFQNTHNHEINPGQVSDVIARYRRLNNEMVQDIKFFLECKVAPITQLEILKKKYPQHVFHKHDVYNTIYKLCQNNDERLDSVSLLDSLFEKMSSDPCWKVFIKHSCNKRRLSGVFWMLPFQQELYWWFSDVVLNDNMYKTNKYNIYLSVFMVKDNYGRFRNVANALVKDELSSTYVWILECLTKATNDIVPKSFWTDSESGLISAVSQVFSNTPHFYCLFHILQNIIKHLRVSLGSNFNEFKKAFFSCRNALSIEVFEHQWEFMVKTFPGCDRYMTKKFTLCEVEEAINKRHEAEIRYCKLTDIKAQHSIIGLPHISSQFFSNVDTVLVNFLTPLILSLQRFQISQSFTYEGRLEHSVPEDLNLDIINDSFIEDMVDEPQATLKALLDGTDMSMIVEVWRIRRIGGFSHKDNLVDNILAKLNEVLKNSPVLTALKPSAGDTIQANFTLQTFSTAKTAINIALEMNCDNELVQLLKNFILTKQNSRNKNDTSEEAESNKNNNIDNSIITLQQNLIDQTNDLHVTKIRGAPNKKRIKSAIEVSKKKNIMQEITSTNNVQENYIEESSSRPQRRCLLCGTPGHYQKKCPNTKEN